MHIKIINELFNILLCTQPWEPDVCFTCTDLRAGQLTVGAQQSHVAVGSRNAEASEIFLVLPVTWSKVVLLEGSELGALDLSFPMCEVRVILPVLLTSQG